MSVKLPKIKKIFSKIQKNQIKIKSSIIISTLLASLAISTSYSASNYEPGYGINDDQLMKAYNASGRVNVSRDWGFFTGGNFLYLQTAQEGMELAEKTRLENGLRGVRDDIVQEFGWDPAFKLHFGWAMGRDQWSLYTEYFYFHATDTTTDSASLENNEYLNMSTLFGNSLNNADYVLTGVYINSHWKIDGNFLDLNLTRPFYNSKQIILKPILGLRAAWLDQKVSGYWLETNQTLHLPTLIKSDSFGIGPKFSLNGKWLLSRSFSLLGDLTASVLHTHYRLKKETHDYVTAAFPVYVYNVHREVHFLRAALETEIGLNWGSYYANRGWHFDLGLTYIFNVYLSQNMISNYYNQLTNTGAGDLYLHGINLKLLFNF